MSSSWSSSTLVRSWKCCRSNRQMTLAHPHCAGSCCLLKRWPDEGSPRFEGEKMIYRSSPRSTCPPHPRRSVRKNRYPQRKVHSLYQRVSRAERTHSATGSLSTADNAERPPAADRAPCLELSASLYSDPSC